MVRTKSKSTTRAPADAAGQFLELYYPIHYKAGIRVEDALRGADLTRHQVAILWMLHSEGEAGERMARKDIAAALRNWFGISNAAVTKAIRGLTDRRPALLGLDDDPTSGREKVVRLTGRGRAHLDRMIRRGTSTVQAIVDELDEAEIVAGLRFFRRISEIVDAQD